MTTVSTIKKAPAYENDAFYVNKAFDVKGKFTGVSVDNNTFNLIKRDNKTKRAQLESDEVRFPNGEYANVFKFVVKGKPVSIVTRQMKLTPDQRFVNTYAFIKNEDVPTFMRNDDMAGLEDAMDALDI